MANTDRPNGFRPAKSLLGAPWTALIRKYTAGDRSSDTTLNHGDIYVGDVVKLEASGGTVIPANSTDVILGVVVGVGTSDDITHGDAGMFTASNLERRYLPAATDGVVYVVPAAGVLFEVQSAADLDLAPGETADIGGTADNTLGANEAHGSQSTGKSTEELVSGSTDVVVVENVTSPDNDISLTNARHLVKFLLVADAIEGS